jgi:hypothetical protein
MCCSCMRGHGQDAGLVEGQIVALESDARRRKAAAPRGLIVTPYDIPRGCLGAYYPESQCADARGAPCRREPRARGESRYRSDPRLTRRARWPGDQAVPAFPQIISSLRAPHRRLSDRRSCRPRPEMAVAVNAISGPSAPSRFFRAILEYCARSARTAPGVRPTSTRPPPRWLRFWPLRAQSCDSRKKATVRVSTNRRPAASIANRKAIGKTCLFSLFSHPHAFTGDDWNVGQLLGRRSFKGS